MKKQGRPKKTKVEITENVIIESVPNIITAEISTETKTCDTPHCGNTAEVFVKFCKSCAQDHRL
mgnify:CR=1 FL=1